MQCTRPRARLRASLESARGHGCLGASACCSIHREVSDADGSNPLNRLGASGHADPAPSKFAPPDITHKILLWPGKDRQERLRPLTIASAYPKITLNNAALDCVADLFKQMGEAADAVGKAAHSEHTAERANSAICSWGGVSFASLWGRIFRR